MDSWSLIFAFDCGCALIFFPLEGRSKPVKNFSPWPLYQLLLPDLTSFGDEEQYGSVSQINPVLPSLILGHDVCAGIETLTKTDVKQSSGDLYRKRGSEVEVTSLGTGCTLKGPLLATCLL